ncbi:NfeD family protein [uncultured Anaerococcus sp.]|uniref:NfeD family protein n=1 Tax=uncultured Anaerococcus sp. TaxID=293428 RepID=UPI0025F94851|nr:NfeD family protein [uncultured Anaerococcus sp.]
MEKSMLGNDLLIATSFILAVISLICLLFTEKKLVFAGISLVLFGYFYLANSRYNIADNITVLTFIVGISLISLELFIPSFGIIGVAGIALTIYSVMDSFASPKKGIFVIIATGLAVVITMTIFVKLGFRVNLFDSYVLDVKERDRKDFHEDKDLSELIGNVGVTKSILRPTGRIEVDGEIYDAMARSEFIEEASVVSVIDVKDGHIIVKEM